MLHWPAIGFSLSLRGKSLSRRDSGLPPKRPDVAHRQYCENTLAGAFPMGKLGSRIWDQSSSGGPLQGQALEDALGEATVLWAKAEG